MSAVPSEITDHLALQPANTRRAYTTAWKGWKEFIGKKWTRFTYSDVLAYIGHLQDLGRAQRTIQSRAMTLRALNDLLVHSGKLKLNPFRDPRSKKIKFDIQPVRRKEMVPFDVVKEVLEIPDTRFADGVRDAAAWAIMFGGGLRRSEVVGLKMDDVRHTPSGQVYLRLTRTKSRKEQNQALPKWVLAYLTRLVAQRHQERARDCDWLFVTYWGGRMSTPWDAQALYRTFRRYAEQLAIKDVSPHSTRKTAITRLVTLGLSLDDVQDFARHKSSETTKGYVMITKDLDQSVANELDFPGL